MPAPTASSRIDAHLIDQLECDPYYAQRCRVGRDNTVFQSLFPGASRVPEQHIVRSPIESPLSDGNAHRRIPSLSASERIKAWEASAAVPGYHDALRPDSTVHFEISGMELFSDCDPDDLLRSAVMQRGVHGDGAEAAAAQPPFHVRAREVEKRFREQMEVHRGLTRAAQQLQLAEHNVLAFRAQRRTHAIMHAIRERQQAIWERVWPGGDIPCLPTQDAPKMDAQSSAGEPRKAAASPLPQYAVKVPASAVVVPAAPTSHISTAPPTNALLQDVLETFSKQRELRGGTSSTRRSASTLLTTRTGATRSKTQSDMNRSSSGRAGTSTDGVDKSFPRVRCVTASGVEIVSLPPPPKPYPVIRYVEVPRSDSQTASKPSTSGAPIPGQLRKVTSGAFLSETTPSLSSISEEYSQSDFIALEASTRDSSRADESALEDNAEAEGSGASRNTSSVEDVADVYSSDTFEVTDESGTANGSKIGEAVTSDISSIVQTARHSSSFTGDSVEDMSETSVVTSSVISRDTDLQRDGRHTPQIHRGRRRQRTRTSQPKSQKKPAAAEDAVERFMAACNAAITASTELLRDTCLREETKTRPAPRPSKPASSAAPPQTPVSSSLSSSAAESSDSSATPAAARASKEMIEPGTTAFQKCREGLETQLRNVRHLRRFRRHLIRHLEMVEMRRKAQREKAMLLQETQTLAKARRTLLRQPPDRDDVDVQKLLSSINRVKQATGTAANKERRRQLLTRSKVLDRVSEEYAVSDEISMEVSDATGSERLSSIEEDIAEEYSVSDEIEDAVSEIIEEVDDDLVHTDVDSDIITESIRSIDEDMTDAVEDTRGTSDSMFSISDTSNPTYTATDGQLDFIVQAGTGLDEIEEELADRLAVMSTTSLSMRNSVPSEIEELIDLLPSSLIPSEVEEEVVEDKGGDSRLHTDSAIATETDASMEELQSRQRRTYVAVKSGVGVQGHEGSKGYMQDSMASAIVAASSDADVDTTLRSSKTTSEAVEDASTVFGTPSKHTREELATAAQRDDAATNSDFTNFTDDSDSTDALTVLETDMALTKERRRAALRSATSVPSWDQLYNPLTPAMGADAAVPNDEALSKQMARQSLDRGAERDTGREEGANESNVSSSAEAGAASTSEVPPNAAEEPAANILQRSSLSDTGAEGQAGVVSDTMADAGAAVSRAASPAYAKEDLVAQNAWKARQLHLLRQLWRVSVEDAVEDTASAETRELQPSSKEHPPLSSKTSVELALDSAEDAAREEWAHHWGVLESLLQTRFAPPRYEERMTAARGLAQRRRASQACVGSSASASANDASPSSWSPSSSAPAVQ
ncbi:hypothetical protein ABL78_1040 [Leptomonas seymouri]|uniref:Uncharacterized protein n=1 Tax=Leptomonas seymouri TaxID=5684 RepID=A0A0N1IMH8_LEPSE|nr:hypothetical protein ABL78_1040 [Leptomonas seymouri]|eukprot:KPI89871.1 hypothetical protein ABL78_1040 [Leptomonas seymouri]